MKRSIALVLLLFGLLLPCWADSFSEVFSLIDELQQIQSERESLLQSLENYNNELLNLNNEKEIELQERKNELQQRLLEIEEKERLLRQQIALSENLGNLIDDQATYLRSLERKLVFYRTGTIAFGVSTIVLTILLIAR